MKKVTVVIQLLVVTIGLFVNAHAASEGQPVSFKTADGGTVHALLYGDSEARRSIVLAHGAIFNKESWPAPLIEQLVAAKFQVLALDFRGYGQSVAGSEPSALELDILAAIDYLHSAGSKAVSLLGGSMGGGAAGRAAVKAKKGEIDKLILLSPVSFANPDQLNDRSLLIIASRDEGMASQIQSLYQRAGQPKKLLWIEGKAHAQHIFKTDQSQQLIQQIVTFLEGA